MSHLPMHIVFLLDYEGSLLAKEELNIREVLEAPTPDELPFEDEFLGHVDGQEVICKE